MLRRLKSPDFGSASANPPKEKVSPASHTSVSRPEKIAGQVRAHYRKGFPILDRFDREMYADGVWLRVKRCSWRASFVWFQMQAALTNGRAAYCSLTQEDLNTATFLKHLIVEYASECLDETR